MRLSVGIDAQVPRGLVSRGIVGSLDKRNDELLNRL